MRKEGMINQKLNLLQTEEAIFFIKQNFQKTLANSLNLYRVSAPLFVRSDSGVQDNLNGTEKPISFTTNFTSLDSSIEIVHSLAKWKRLALQKYKIPVGKGLYTDMNAIRPDERDLRTGIHSIYVDQWDWEKIISPESRNLKTLKSIVKKIYNCFLTLESEIYLKYSISSVLPKDIFFIHSEELYNLYPDLPPEERENKICQKYGAVFLIGIGGQLPDGNSHDGRAPDYDDWSTPTLKTFKGLNGDILVYNPISHHALELSSMGIRVNKDSLIRQLKLTGNIERAALPWHQKLLNGQLPQTIGGGIGQSRLCMFLLRKRHIGEVQASIWPEEVITKCRKEGIQLL